MMPLEQDDHANLDTDSALHRSFFPWLNRRKPWGRRIRAMPGVGPGTNTRAVLSDWGLDTAEIDGLLATGAVSQRA